MRYKNRQVRKAVYAARGGLSDTLHPYLPECVDGAAPPHLGGVLSIPQEALARILIFRRHLRRPAPRQLSWAAWCACMAGGIAEKTKQPVRKAQNVRDFVEGSVKVFVQVTLPHFWRKRRRAHLEETTNQPVILVTFVSLP